MMKGLIPAVSSVHLLYFSISLRAIISAMCIDLVLQLMNFFKEINRVANRLNEWGNMSHQPSWTGQPDPLTQLVRSCTYPENVKHAVEKSVRQVLSIHNTYKFDKIEYVESKQQHRYLQLKGNIEVPNKNTLPINIMYPAGFPNKAPFVRIVNPSPKLLAPYQSFKPLQSSNDPLSFVLNDKLQKVKNWQPHSSVVEIILEVTTIVKTVYPFVPLNQPVNNWPSNSRPVSSGYSQQQQYPQQSSQQGWGQRAPPIPFQTASNQDRLANAAKMVGQQKQRLKKMSAQHQQLLEGNQQLSLMNYSLDSEYGYLSSQNFNMSNFVQSNQQSTTSAQLLDMVAPADQLSQAVLELTSSIKAREDCEDYLESRFNDEAISLEDFMKGIRRIEEDKFMDKAMLIKGLQQISRIRRV